MTEQAESIPPATDLRPAVDRGRVRSFVGLVLGRLGPRAHGAVAGSFLTLLVGEQTRSLFWIAFALSAHRFVTWAAHPIAGRLSDRSDTRWGRRVPYMVVGLVVAGACTTLYTNVDGYWPLVVLMVIARIAFAGYSIPSYALTPETFGGSRWVRAVIALAIGGLVVGVSIRVTVIATWDQNDPSTWSPAYYLAAAYIAFAALCILFLVREGPPLRRDDHHEPPQWRAAIAEAFAAPNAKFLLPLLFLAVAAGGAFERAYPIYARDALGAGGDDIAAAGIANAAILVVLFPLSLWLAGRLPRRALAVSSGLVWAVAALAHLWVVALWQSVVILALAAVWLNGAVIALAGLYLRLIPRRGGLGQRLGLVIAPLLLADMAARFASALAYDLLRQDFDVIWIITAVLSFGAGVLALGVRLPPWARRADLRYGYRVLRELLWGERSSRRLFRGELHAADTDGTALLESVQDALDPYVRRPIA